MGSSILLFRFLWGGGGEGGVRIISAILSDPDLSLPESRKSAGSLPKWPLVIKSIGREGGGGVSQYHVIEFQE